MILTGASDIVRVVTDSAATLDVLADWADMTTAAFTPGRTPTAIASVTTTTVVGSPAASTQRQVKNLSLRNRHASTSVTVTVQFFDGTTSIDLWKGVLTAGERVEYDGAHWQAFDAAGTPKTISSGSGVWLATFVKTTGTTHVVGPRTNTIFVRMVGGGGGGGGCASVASAAGAAGGGGSGAYAEKTFTVTPSTSYTIAIGGAGTNGSGAAGGNGGSTTFAVGATTVTAPGGTGGPLCTPAATLIAVAGGAGGAIATNGDLNSGGQPGGYGVCLIVATPIVAAGHGGSGPFGRGGVGIVAVGAGVAAIGFGAGGGGSATGASVARAGGAPTPGVIIVDEYA